MKSRELTGDQIRTRGRTSRRAARLEIALSTHISLSLGDGVPLALPEQVDTSLRGSILNDDQRKVLAEIALSSDRVMGVHGVAGSGKSTLIQELKAAARSEAHTSELQSLMRISYDAFCLTKKITITTSR